MSLGFALNVSATLADRPLLDRFAVAAAAGFDAVELYWPDEATLAGASLDDVAEAIRASGLGVSLVNLDGDLVDPDLARFDDRLQRAIGFAVDVGCPRLNLPAGEGDRTDVTQRALLVERVGRAADAAAASGLETELEAINPTSEPSWLLSDVAEVESVIRAAGRQNVRFQLDVFHLQMVGRDVIATIDALAGRIGHVQLADMPGRHEPGTGTLPIARILSRLVERGYDGDVGLEYVPTKRGPDAFAYLGALHAARAAPVPR
jgi:hydroxypyruvate isomerase